jgi:hypothetical protein
MLNTNLLFNLPLAQAFIATYSTCYIILSLIMFYGILMSSHACWLIIILSQSNIFHELLNGLSLLFIIIFYFNFCTSFEKLFRYVKGDNIYIINELSFSALLLKTIYINFCIALDELNILTNYCFIC